MDSESSSAKIEKLNATNFHAWKQKIFHLLVLKDLEEYIEADPPVGTDLAAWRKKDIKAQAIIGLTLSDDLLENVREVQSTKEMWKKICDVFQRHTLLNKLAARRKFYTATMGNNESVLQFSNRVLQLASTLKSMDVTVDESETSMALLNGLPEDYAPLITAMDTMSGENEVLKFDYVKSRVMQEEQRITIRTSRKKKLMQGIGKIRSRKYCSYAKQQLPTASTSRPPRSTCGFCKKKGHNDAACWKKNPHLNPHKKQNPQHLSQIAPPMTILPSSVWLLSIRATPHRPNKATRRIGSSTLAVVIT